MKKYLLSIFSFLSFSVFAQWNGNPTGNNIVCNFSATTSKANNVSASDGNNGSYIAWEETRYAGTGTDIYLQRLRKDGSRAFADSGLRVCGALGTQSNIYAVSDGASGIVIIWQDARNSSTTGDDIYAQRIDSTGTVLWAVDGVVVCNANLTQATPLLVLVNNTTLIATWRDSRGSSSDPYCNRLQLSDGGGRWINDLQLSNAAGTQTNYGILADGSGGAFIIWEDPTGNPPSTSDRDIFGERVNNTGTKLWLPASAIGKPLVSVIGAQQQASICTDGSTGFFMAWADQRTGTVGGGDIYAQRFDLNGDKVFANDVQMVNAVGIQSNPQIVASNSNSAFVFWSDPRQGTSNRDIYVQKITSIGALAFTPSSMIQLDGIAIVTATGHQPSSSTFSGFASIPDGLGGAFVVWDDARTSSSDLNIYAQRVTSSGTLLATTDGVSISTAANNQRTPSLVISENNSVIISFNDSRNGTSATNYSEVRAVRLNNTGLLPLQLTQLFAKRDKENIILNWETANENNNSHFEVEKLNANNVFVNLGNVQAKNRAANAYTFTNTNAGKGVNLFRLKMVDAIGKFSYSNTVRVDIDGLLNNSLSIYPNPVQSIIQFAFNANEKELFTLNILSADGKIVKNQQQQMAQGYNTVSVNANDLPTGTYVLQLINSQQKRVATQSFIK